MDSNLEINVDFIVNNPQLQVEAEAARATITGVTTSIEEINRKLAEARRVSTTTTDITVLRQNNARIQELEQSLQRMTNVGRTGFDAMGNAIQNNGSFIGKAVAMLYRVGNILPGIGVAGLLAFAIDPIVSYLSKLELFKEKLTDLEKTNKSLGESLASGGDYAKAVTSVTSLRINLDLARQKMYDKTKVVEEYNKTIGAVAGQVRNLDQVERGLADNADNYIKMTLYKAAANKALEEASSKVIAIEKERLKKDSEEVGAGNKILNALTAGDYKNQKLYEKSYKEIATKNRKSAIDALETEKQSLESIAKGLQEKAAAEAIKMGGVLGTDTSVKKPTVDTSYVDRAEGLQRKILEIREEYTRKSLEKDDEEVQAIRDKFLKLAEEVRKFNGDKKNKIKVDGSGLIEVRDKAITDLKYQQDTEKLKQNLSEQKGMYESYEMFKEKFGEEKAKIRFGKELDVSKTYIQVLEEQYGKLSSKTELTGGEKERLAVVQKELKQAKIELQKVEDDLLSTSLKAAQTYNDKLVEIEKTYQEQKKSLLKSGEFTIERDAALQQQKEEAINAAKDEALAKTTIFKQTSIEILELSRKQVLEQVKLIEGLLKNAQLPAEVRDKLTTDLSKLKVVLKFDIDNANLRQYKKRYEELVQEISQVDKNGNSIISEKERGRILSAITEIRAKIKSIDSSGDGKITYFDKLLENFSYLEGNATEIATGLAKDLGQLSGSFEQIGSAVAQTNEGLGNTIKGLGSVLNLASSAAKAFASFSTGDIVGGIGSILSIVSTIVASNAAIEKQQEQYYSNLMKGEQAYQDLLKQRSLDLVKENKTNLKAIEDEFALRKSILADYAAESDKIMKQLAGMNYKDVFINQDQLFGLIKGGSWLRTSLAGKTFDELKLLLDQDRLDGEAKNLVQRLVELEQKGYDVTQVMKDLASQLAVLFTGTTSDKLTDSLVQMFKDGKTSAQDFADFFQQSMQDAALSIFKNKVLAVAMEKFYTDFAGATQDGALTADEVATLKDKYTALVNEANVQFQALKDMTGLSSLGASSSSASSMTGTIARTITEQTGSELVGLYRNMYDQTKKGVQTWSESLAVLQETMTVQYAIQANTANTVTELKSAVTELKAINTNTKPNSTAYDRGL